MSKIKCTSECRSNVRSVPSPVQRPDITYHAPLYFISVITSLACPIALKQYNSKTNFWYTSYSIFSMIVIIIATLYSGYWRQYTAYKYLIQTVKITDVIQQALLLTANVYAIFNVLWWGSEQINVYFGKIVEIDKHLCTTANLRKKKIWYFIRFIFIHIMMIALCLFDYFAWTHAMGTGIYIYYSFRLYTIYLNIVIVLQINAFASTVETRFEILNERLLDTFYNWSHESKEEIVQLCGTFKTLNSFCPKTLPLRCILKIHDILCDIIDLINKVYGFNIVLLVANIIVNSVMALNITLIFGTGIQSATNNKESSSGNIVLLNIAWALLFLIMGVVVSWSCTTCSNEGWRTATLAFKLVNLIPLDDRLDPGHDMTQQLIQITQQVQLRRPGFSAAGFFTVDYSMLYATIGSIASYIVIVIQFNNSPILINANYTHT